MKILFDQGTPAPLRKFLYGHDVKTAFEMGWSKLSNGLLVDRADGEFDLMITTDQSLRYQQNLNARRLAILILPTTSWPKLQAWVDQIGAVVNVMQPATFHEFSPEP